MKLTLDNFQSIEHAEFDFPVGITILQGKNGSGKTAVFRAIKGLLTNPSGSGGFVRNGCTDTKVTLENNNNSVTWIRSKNSSTYINNVTGDEYVKASKLDSRDIADLGFYFDNNGKVINIHDEWSVLFPFGESDADMFKLFEDNFNISYSTNVLESFKKDEKKIKSRITSLQVSLDEKTKRIVDIENRFKCIDEDRIKQLGVSIKNAETLVSDLKTAYSIFLENSSFSARAIPELFDLSALSILEDECVVLEKCLTTYNKSLSLINCSVPKLDTALFSFEDIESKFPCKRYSELIRTLKDIEIELKDLNNRQIELSTKISSIKICPTCGRPLED